MRVNLSNGQQGFLSLHRNKGLYRNYFVIFNTAYTSCLISVKMISLPPFDMYEPAYTGIGIRKIRA